MSEGLEIKIITDKISSLLKGKEIENIIFKNLDSRHIKNKILGSKLENIKPFGKNLVFRDFPSQSHDDVW